MLEIPRRQEARHPKTHGASKGSVQHNHTPEISKVNSPYDHNRVVTE